LDLILRTLADKLQLNPQTSMQRPGILGYQKDLCGCYAAIRQHFIEDFLAPVTGSAIGQYPHLSAPSRIVSDAQLTHLTQGHTLPWGTMNLMIDTIV
jgi:hypothetical protein